MAKHKKTVPSVSQEQTERTAHTNEVFALENVTQLREAIDQVVYGETETTQPNDPERIHTVENLTTLGQMGILTETDLDEARKGYL
ncbi:hypothetical protein WBJ53_17935 [Spirosoma sp. SC4-14]|uniref:hypothetical protein n=1 Tax=Spirosoma sp. SC4-14 TaxID=3128900 RepID=UPI0030CB8E4D